MTIRAGPLLWSLLQESERVQPLPVRADGEIVAVLLAGLLLALLLDCLNR